MIQAQTVPMLSIPLVRCLMTGKPCSTKQLALQKITDLNNCLEYTAESKHIQSMLAFDDAFLN